MFCVVNYYPAAVGASATTRQLPIYCVPWDQQLIFIRFDAAWSDARAQSNRMPYIGRDPLQKSTLPVQNSVDDRIVYHCLRNTDT